MQIGVIYPQTEFGHDPTAIRDYAQMAEALGYHHILTYEHVLGASPNRPGGWHGPYTHEHEFLEPFALFNFMAAVTTQIAFVTGILILPQRQTALVAKQAATLDVLSGGRLRLGVGVGWNPVEYVALNRDFHTRGQRIEEQVLLLRKLWTERLVNFDGQSHRIEDAGLNPLPVQQPIPIWFGGHADAVLRRIARMGDGWFPNYRRPADAQPSLERLRAYLTQAGRKPKDIGIEARIYFKGEDPAGWRALSEQWQAAGATHLTVNTMGAGLGSPQAHMDAIRAVAGALL